jgi:phosphoribosylformylglycinamidine synthase
LAVGDVLRLPVAHGDGAYFADSATLAWLEATGRVVARYVESDGALTEAANPNGSVASIAAIANERGNVVGLMPHPERAANRLVGGDDGLKILRSAMAYVGAAV